MRVKEAKTDDLVKIEWLDSVGPKHQSWMQPEDLDPCTVSGIESVGWVYERSKDAITIVHSVDRIHGGFNGVITIPLCAIVAIEKL